MVKMFLILSKIYSFTFFRKLLCEINRIRLAILNILLILTTLSAPVVSGMKKKAMPKTTSKVSTLFQRSLKKFSGPMARILMRSYARKTHTKMTSKVREREL